MNIRKQLSRIAGVVAVLAMTATAQAGTRPFMARGETVEAPPGFTDLCQRDEISCGSPSALAAPAGALAMTTLSTSSLGRSWPMAQAVAAELRADQNDAAALGLVMVESLTAYRPAAVEDFLPVGVARQVAQVAPVMAPTVMAAAGPVQLDNSQLKLITSVNRDVNRDVRKANDFDIYGLLEFWSLPRVIDGKMYGDCEDYALEKRRRLIAAGVPAEALSMAVAVTARGERHAVLVVAFEAGDMVLDNLTPWPTPWAELNYSWVQRQVAGSTTWTTVS